MKGRQSNYEDESLDVFQYFNSSCYKGFGDDNEGFYTVYRIVFEKIAAEDSEYMEEEEFLKIPMFGNSKSSFDDIVTFYGYWESYSTKKSYSWLFTHDVNEIRDRRVLKLIDKEHKKIQQKARKERNEEIRSLVLFVKKRDKRMVEYRKMLEEKAAHNRLKSQQNRLEQIRKRTDEIREQQRNSKIHKDQQETLQKLEMEYLNQQFSDDDSDEYSEEEDIEDIENDLEECQIDSDSKISEEEIIDEDLYCVACNKSFKTLTTKINHEASKKHKQNVELLKGEMNLEEENYQKTVNGSEDHDISDEGLKEEIEDVATTSKSKSKKSKKKKSKGIQSVETPLKSDNEHDESLEAPVDKNSIGILNNDDSTDDDWSSNKKGKKSKSKATKKEKPDKKSKINEIKEAEIDLQDNASKPEESTELDIVHRCATCNQTFSSKNKLFTHLKATNHSIHLGELKQKSIVKVANKKKK